MLDNDLEGGSSENSLDWESHARLVLHTLIPRTAHLLSPYCYAFFTKDNIQPHWKKASKKGFQGRKQSFVP
jgi:hypothetical protein